MAEDNANGPNLVSMAQQFTGLPMGDLIGSPLMAAATANSQMGLAQVQFMLDLCFKKPGTVSADDKKTVTEGYEPVMIDMTLTRNYIVPPKPPEDNSQSTPLPSVTPIKTIISLPLLTIIPLNSLAVQTVDVNFEMEVKSSYSEEHTKNDKTNFKQDGTFETKINYFIGSTTIHGTVSHDRNIEISDKNHYQKSNSAKYTVAVHAGQLPLPEGVNVILKAYTQNISPIELKTTAETNKEAKND